MPKKSKESHPESLYNHNNEVIPWENAPDELRQAFWISIGVIHLFPKIKRGPDMGHGKCSRRKCRGGPKCY